MVGAGTMGLWDYFLAAWYLGVKSSDLKDLILASSEFRLVDVAAARTLSLTGTLLLLVTGVAAGALLTSFLFQFFSF